MIHKKDKARTVYERLRNNKQPMNLWEHVRNHQFKAEMQNKIKEERKPTPQAPDLVQNHINLLK